MSVTPVLRADILALEAVAAQGWPAPETARLGDWLLRAGEGWTRRANSALLVGDPGLPLTDALEYVRAWYAERGLAPRLAVPLPAMSAADEVAADLGWVADIDAEVRTAPVTPAPPDPGVVFAPTPETGWIAVYRAKTVPPVGARILAGPDTVTFGSIMDGDRTVAVGRGVVVAGWLGITSMEVLPDGGGWALRPCRPQGGRGRGQRSRRGLAARMLHALLAWGASHGMTRCYLQFEATNEPARAFYRGMGFTRHHHYRNRVWRRDTR